MSMIHIMGEESTSGLTNVDSSCVQPNAVDLRVGKIFLIRPKTFTISEDEKVHRGSVELRPNAEGWFVLEAGSYEVVMDHIITVGEGEAGWVITRSTLNRNGVFLTSGLYDTGYEGVMAAVMHVTCGPMRIKQGTRIGQYISMKSENIGKYEGSYGLNSQHDQKYSLTAPFVANATTITISTAAIDQLKDQLKIEGNISTTDEPAKRGRGRPKGSPNKPKENTDG